MGFEDAIKCAICATTENLIEPAVTDFTCVCEKHREYKGAYQLDAIKVKEGYLENLPDMNCAICEKALTPEEKGSIKVDEFSKTCNEHRWMAHSFLYGQFRDQYKAGQPFMHAGRILTKDFPQGIEAYKKIAKL